MNAVFELVLASSALPPGFLALRAGCTRAVQARPVIYELRFPASLTADDVETFLASLTGLLPPWWKRIVRQPVVGFELVVTNSAVRHRLVVPPAVEGQLTSALQAHIPSVRYEAVPDATWTPRQAAEYRTTTDDRPLRTDPVGIAAGLLTSVQPLHRGERVVVQWMLTAGWPARPPRVAKAGDRVVMSDADLLASSEQVTARRAKLRAPLLLAVGRIGAEADSDRRASQLVRRAEGPLHASRAPGAHLKRRLVFSRLVTGRLVRRVVPITRFPSLLNVEEAAGLLGWPIGGPAVPGLVLGGLRLLPVPSAVPSMGTVLGTATFAGQTGRPVAMDLDARFRHLAVTGPTGTGKTTVLTHVALSDLLAGHAVVVIDPKGDLVTNILERLPAKRLSDVIVLDPSAGGRAVGYNPLLATGGHGELAVEQVLGVMKNIWRANWGPRTDALLRACLSTLIQVGGMTICEIEPLLVNADFRRKLVSTISDPFGIEAAWAQYESWSDGEQIAAAGPLLNKIQALTTRGRLRSMFGQATGAVDFGRIIQNHQVLLVNLAVGSLGTEASYITGALLFAGLWDAVSARGSMPSSHRQPVMAILDEAARLFSLPTPAETVLAEARSQNMGLVLGFQQLQQASSELQEALMSNARSKLVFQSSRRDATALAKELGRGLTPEDLMGIPAYEAVAAVFAVGQVQPATTLATTPLGPPLRTADSVRRASQQRWGVDKADVEAAMVTRQHGPRQASPRVGRSRRGQV